MCVCECLGGCIPVPSLFWWCWNEREKTVSQRLLSNACHFFLWPPNPWWCVVMALSRFSNKMFAASLYLSVSLPTSVCEFIQPSCGAVHVSKEPDLPWLPFSWADVHCYSWLVCWKMERQGERLTDRETEKEINHCIGTRVKCFPVVWSYYFKEMYHFISREQGFLSWSKIWSCSKNMWKINIKNGVCWSSISFTLYNHIFIKYREGKKIMIILTMPQFQPYRIIWSSLFQCAILPILIWT